MDGKLTIAGFLTDRAQRFPDTNIVAYQKGNEAAWTTLNWATYYEKIKSASELLLSLKVKAEDRIVIILPTSLQWDLFEKGCLLIGATVIGIETHARPVTMSEIIKQVRPRLIIIEDLGITKILKEQFNISPDIFLNVSPNTWMNLHAYNRKNLPKVSANATATIIFTSGSTGHQKGITYTQKQFLQAAQTLASSLAQKNGRTVCWLPQANLFQRMTNLFSLINNTSIYFLNNPKEVMNVLPKIQPTAFIGVPVVYEKIYTSVKQQTGSQAAIFGGKMKYMITGSAPCRLDVLTFFKTIGIPLIEGYGMSENILPIALNLPHEYKLGSVGKPLLPNRVKIADDGEILMKGPGLFKGYLGKKTPVGTTKDGFFPTGDLGYLDKKGFLFLTGRKDNLIKTSTGRKISTTAIGAQLMENPFLNQVLLVGSDRPCLTCLVTVDNESVKNKDIAVILKNTIQFIQKTNSKLSSFEKIKGGIILEKNFSVENAELTANLKIRRKQIEENYQNEIEYLYKKIELIPRTNDSFFEELTNKKGYYFLCQ